VDGSRAPDPYEPPAGSGDHGYRDVIRDVARADIARLGFTANLAAAWLTSFAIGVVVAIPTAILVAPAARRLVSHLTGVRPARHHTDRERKAPLESAGPSPRRSDRQS
jgi:hypothetical protein